MDVSSDTSLTLGACARGLQYSVGVCGVRCLEGLYNKVNMSGCFTVLSKDFQRTVIYLHVRRFLSSVTAFLLICRAKGWSFYSVVPSALPYMVMHINYG